MTTMTRAPKHDVGRRGGERRAAHWFCGFGFPSRPEFSIHPDDHHRITHQQAVITLLETAGNPHHSVI